MSLPRFERSIKRYSLYACSAALILLVLFQVWSKDMYPHGSPLIQYNNMKYVGNKYVGKDQETLKKSATFRERLAYYHPYDPSKPIPKAVRQTWKCNLAEDGCNTASKGAELTWDEMNPDIERVLVIDDKREEYLLNRFAGTPEILQAFWMLSKPILQADFLRYLMVFADGGVYSDLDTQCLKPIAEWAIFDASVVNRTYGQPKNTYTIDPNTFDTPVGIAIGLEGDVDPDEKDWRHRTARFVQFCQWTFQAKPGHLLLLELIARIVEETTRLMLAGKLTDGFNVFEWTGPAIFTDVIYDYLNNVLSDGRLGDGVGVGSKFWLDNEYYKMKEYPVDENFRPLNSAKQIVSWKTFTQMTEPMMFDDVMILPITSFDPGMGHMGSKPITDPMAYVKHLSVGTWKPVNEGGSGEST